MAETVKTGTSTNDMNLDWEAAGDAAKAIARLCADAVFIAPENAAGHHDKVVRVCAQLEHLVTALRISKR